MSIRQCSKLKQHQRDALQGGPFSLPYLSVYQPGVHVPFRCCSARYAWFCCYFSDWQGWCLLESAVAFKHLGVDYWKDQTLEDVWKCFLFTPRSMPFSQRLSMNSWVPDHNVCTSFWQWKRFTWYAVFSWEWWKVSGVDPNFGRQRWHSFLRFTSFLALVFLQMRTSFWLDLLKIVLHGCWIYGLITQVNPDHTFMQSFSRPYMQHKHAMVKPRIVNWLGQDDLARLQISVHHPRGASHLYRASKLQWLQYMTFQTREPDGSFAITHLVAHLYDWL